MCARRGRKTGGPGASQPILGPLSFIGTQEWLELTRSGQQNFCSSLIGVLNSYDFLSGL